MAVFFAVGFENCGLEKIFYFYLYTYIVYVFCAFDTAFSGRL